MLGTRFDLDARPAALDLVVVDGIVVLAWNDASVELHAGERVTLRDDRDLEVRRVEDAYDSLDRLGSFVSFADTPLPAVVLGATCTETDAAIRMTAAGADARAGRPEEP